MVLFSQIACLLVIVALGFFVFKKYPIKLQLREMTLASLFVVLALVVSYFSIMIPLFGFPSLKLSLSQIPLMCLGMLLGPSYAFIAGIIYDLLALVINPTSFPFLGFTLNNILVCVIPALWYQHKHSKKNILTISMMVGIISIIVFILYLWTCTDSVAFIDKYMELTVQMKMGITIAFIIFMILTMVVLGLWISKKQDEEMLQWMFCLLMIEVFIHLCLSPLWLEIMYGIPYMVNFFMRIIKTVVVIPLFSILGLPIVKLSKRLYKGV